jgi:hypothetical protein
MSIIVYFAAYASTCVLYVHFEPGITETLRTVLKMFCYGSELLAKIRFVKLFSNFNFA